MLHLVWEGVKVSVLFNEPKLLKSARRINDLEDALGFSALQRAEIAEIIFDKLRQIETRAFQCSSTSRNC